MRFTGGYFAGVNTPFVHSYCVNSRSYLSFVGVLFDGHRRNQQPKLLTENKLLTERACARVFRMWFMYMLVSRYVPGGCVSLVTRVNSRSCLLAAICLSNVLAPKHSALEHSVE